MIIASNWVVNNLNKALETWNNSINEIFELIRTPIQSFKGGSVWLLIEKINSGLQAIGLSLLVLFFVINILKTCTSFEEVKKPERAIRFFIRFVIAKFLVTQNLELMTKIFSITQGISNKIFASASTQSLGIYTALPEEIKTAILNSGFVESIPLWSVTLLGSLFITILSYVIILTIYGRFFKLYLYTALSPIPLSTSAGESTQHITVSFFKSYIAVCLESAVVVLSCIIFSSFASSNIAINSELEAINIVWSYVSEIVFNMLVLTATIKMSERVVKEMMGL